jgi:short-subunit dehydrogenase
VGVSFARQLAAAGLNLLLIARQRSLLDRLAGELTAAHAVQVRILVLDLGRADTLDRIREMTDDVAVGLVVFNAAASTGTGAFLEASLERALSAVRLGPVNYVALSHHFGQKMLRRGRGGFIFVGSLAGNAGAATTVLYSAGKAFAQTLAEGLWSELKPRGVDVLYAVLGATRTPARERVNMKDSPDQFVAEPDDVARECLENLTNGPVLVPAHLSEAFQMFTSLPRRQAAETMTNLLLSFKQ